MSYYSEKIKCINELKGLIKKASLINGVKINKDRIIFEMTQHYAVPKNAIEEAVDNMIKFGQIREDEEGNLEWVDGMSNYKNKLQ